MGIFDGYQKLLEKELGLTKLSHRSSLFRGEARDSTALFLALHAEVAKSWKAAIESTTFRPSTENYRWFEPKLTISTANKSPEVTLERALVAAACRQGRRDWSNQVPIVSGIDGSSAGKRRAIDLVRLASPQEAEFVELKMRLKADTPLFAAAEIVLYGLLWLCARRDKARFLKAPSPLLEANTLTLSVLAPRAFYQGVVAGTLARFFHTGLSAVGDTEGVKLSFALTAFPDDFQWPTAADDAWLLRQLDERQPV